MKKEGKWDWRQFNCKPIDMQSFSWDNCQYNVYESAMAIVRGRYIMLVCEGCTEPIDLKYLWNWLSVCESIKKNTDARYYDVWDVETKKLVGSWSSDGYLHYNKMNNKNTQKLNMAGIAFMEILPYAAIAGAVFSGLVFAQMNGWIGSGLESQIEALRAGLVQIYQEVKT